MKQEKIRIHLKSYDHRLIDRSAREIIDAVVKSGSKISGPIPIPTKIKRFTVIKSPHVNKTSREQFEMRIHKRMLEITVANPRTLNMLASFALPSGVGIQVE